MPAGGTLTFKGNGLIWSRGPLSHDLVGPLVWPLVMASRWRSAEAVQSTTGREAGHAQVCLSICLYGCLQSHQDSAVRAPPKQPQSNPGTSSRRHLCTPKLDRGSALWVPITQESGEQTFGFERTYIQTLTASHNPHRPELLRIFL